jgi:EAL domain-containing protein (putative c-di-GMP-specific phosphodiesterase class I)
MAVNLSPRQFHDAGLVSFIEKALLESGVSSDSLELEITEGVLLSAHANPDEALAALSRLGVHLAMDDFGTGYSSLSYLRRYPFNVLKIDRSFVNDIATDPADRELINATIAMAHALGLKVVAEGVETEEQLRYLKNLNCDYAQGYLFSKPMPGVELAEWLANRAYSKQENGSSLQISAQLTCQD